MTQTCGRRAGSAPGLLWTPAWSCSFGQVWMTGMGWDWLAVLSQKGLVSPGSVQAVSSRNAPQKQWWLFNFGPLHLGNGFRASDTRGKMGARPVSPTASRLHRPCSQLVPSIASSLVAGHLGLLPEAVAHPLPARRGCLALNCCPG